MLRKFEENKHLLLDMRKEGVVRLDHLLHGVHPDLPDPLPEVRTVPGTAHPQQKVSKYRHLEVELNKGLRRGGENEIEKKRKAPLLDNYN